MIPCNVGAKRHCKRSINIARFSHDRSQSEDIAQLTLKSIGPNVHSGRCINQLPDDADFSHRLAYAEFAPDLLDINDFALVSKTRIARDHE
jgi:hypothetical protein